MTNTITVIYGSGQSATPASSVFYTVVGADGFPVGLQPNQLVSGQLPVTLIERTNQGVTAILDTNGNPTGTFSVQIVNWNPNWSGTITWDITGGNVQTITYDTWPSYSTILDATAYFNSRLYATLWQATSTQSQQNALNDATRILNRMSWKAFKTFPDQLHSWPRTGIYLELVVIDQTIVPKDLCEAQFEIALALLKGYDPEKDARNAAVISRGYSSVRVAYDAKLLPEYIRYGIPSLAAWTLMLPYLNFGPADTVRLHRV